MTGNHITGGHLTVPPGTPAEPAPPRGAATRYGLTEPLDITNPRHMEEIRVETAAWMREHGEDMFAGVTETEKPTPAEAAAAETRRLYTAHLFHIDARTTRRLLIAADQLPTYRLSPELVPRTSTGHPVNKGMALFASPIAITSVGVGNIHALTWEVRGTVLHTSVYIDVRTWRLAAAVKHIDDDGYPIERAAAEVTHLTAPNLCYENGAELLMEGEDRQWLSTLARQHENEPDFDLILSGFNAEARCEPWIRVLIALWQLLARPVRHTETVPPGKASARRLAATPLPPGTLPPPPGVRIVEWRQPPPARAAPPAPPEQRTPTGRTWTLDHEVNVAEHQRRLRDENGNIRKIVTVRSHTRGAGLGNPHRRVFTVTE